MLRPNLCCTQNVNVTHSFNVFGNASFNGTVTFTGPVLLNSSNINETVPCVLAVGSDWSSTELSTAKCGDSYQRRLYSGNGYAPDGAVAAWSDPRLGSFTVASTIFTDDRNTTWYGTRVLDAFIISSLVATTQGINAFQEGYYISSTASTAIGTVSLHPVYTTFAGALNILQVIGAVQLYTFAANYTGAVPLFYMYAPRITSTPGASASVTDLYIYADPLITGTMAITNRRVYSCSRSGSPTSGKNVCHHGIEQTGATNNAWGHMDCNTQTDGCALMAGTSFDTKLVRGRAGAWTLGTGHDFYTDGFLCAGSGCTSSAPTSASTGVYDSGTRVCSSVSCSGATCSLSAGALSITVTPTLPTTGSMSQLTLTGLPLIAGGSSPTVTFANSSPTCGTTTGSGITGKAGAGLVYFVTGASACSVGKIFEITIPTTCASRLICTVTPFTDTNSAFGFNSVYWGPTTTTGGGGLQQQALYTSVNLAQSTSYGWQYICSCL